MPDLFSPTHLGALRLKNRIIMAPMTRARAGASRIPNALMATHYAQRAGSGLIITEATQVSVQGTGSAFTPGIHSPAQIEGWREVTDSVHDAGGTIVLQLWHVGRVSHESLLPKGAVPVSPSAIRGNVNTFTTRGFEPTSEPRALAIAEIPAVVEAFHHGACNAIEAGFDGVEIHGANGYLIDQFLRDGVNQRDDLYGGSIENRCRFLLDVTDAVVDAVGADRTGLRLSPFTVAWDCIDSDPGPLFLHAAEEIGRRGLAYLHGIERTHVSPTASESPPNCEDFTPQQFRAAYCGAYVANGGYDRELGMLAVGSHHADAVAYARPYISNPDLAERFRKNAPLNRAADLRTIYGGGAEGYNDYPALGDG